MYQITVDGKVLYDPRDDEYIVTDPKCKMEVNTVGEASFTIHATHPYYSSIRKLRSIIEITQDGEPIFRGRVTGDTMDFDNSSAVDVEGVLAFLNDSIVRPYSFPDDFTNDSGYIEASKSGNVIAFFLGWLIEQHNSQVDDFQRLKLGKVTVTDPNNYLTRSNSKYASTWKAIEEKLFKSALGGYLCIRYEDDGNYVDYLSDFELTNTQRITYGENLLDLTNESDASETYSAVIPLGAKTGDNGEQRLTLAAASDGVYTDDIVIEGDIMYSVSARKKYGFILAPVSETTWDDVTQISNLCRKSAEYLLGEGMRLTNTTTVKAVDLHFTDEEIASFRIYRYVEIDSAPHNHQWRRMLSKIDLDIENPQNTIFTIGDKSLTLTDVNASTRQDVAVQIENAAMQSKQQVAGAIAESENRTAGAIAESENRTSVVITDRITEITRTCESLILSALDSYVEESNFETYKETVKAQLEVLAGEINFTFSKLITEINNVDGDLQEKFNQITKYFTFDINGLTIGQVDNPYKIVLDNDRYSMLVNNIEVLWIANGQVYTPELTVHTKANFFGYVITKDSNGNVNCEYAGEG